MSPGNIEKIYELNSPNSNFCVFINFLFVFIHFRVCSPIEHYSYKFINIFYTISYIFSKYCFCFHFRSTHCYLEELLNIKRLDHCILFLDSIRNAIMSSDFNEIHLSVICFYSIFFIYLVQLNVCICAYIAKKPTKS